MDTIIPQKCCSKCKQLKPATTDYFHRASKEPDGLQWYCKACRKFPPRKPPVPDGYKRCPGCKQEFPATADYFHKASATKDGLRHRCKKCSNEQADTYRTRDWDKILEKQRKWRAQHREFVNAQAKRYHAIHKERHNARWRRYHAIHREALISHKQSYRQAHRDELNRIQRQKRNGNIEKARRQDKIYYQRYRLRYIVKAHKRRALILAAGGSYTADDIRQQFKRQKGKCYYCHQKLVKYHIDHVIPVARGGSNDPSNLVLACPTCNLHKSDKLPHEWYEGGRLL